MKQICFSRRVKACALAMLAVAVVVLSPILNTAYASEAVSVTIAEEVLKTTYALERGEGLENTVTSEQVSITGISEFEPDWTYTNLGHYIDEDDGSIYYFVQIIYGLTEEDYDQIYAELSGVDSVTVCGFALEPEDPNGEYTAPGTAIGWTKDGYNLTLFNQNWDGSEGFQLHVMLSLNEDEMEELLGVNAYTVTAGNGSAFTTGSGEGLALTINGTVGDVVSIAIDGEVISAENYTLTEGDGTVLTLKPEFLNKLSTDEYTVTFNFKNGKAASASFSIVAAATTAATTSPETDDAAATTAATTSPETDDAAATTAATTSPKTGDAAAPCVAYTLLGMAVFVGALSLRKSRK